MNATTATKAYAAVEIESGVHSADPHKLIAMLYQGALLAIANAKNAMLRKDIPAKGAAISKAILIIGDGLQASLDKNVGGQLALNLDALYGYMCTRLMQANANNDVAALDEVSRLLGELKGAWDSIRQTVTAATAAPAPQAAVPNKQPALVYGRM
ncbi:MAG: flagellar export chaperone FliS [Pseudomonadota bacterium]